MSEENAARGQTRGRSGGRRGRANQAAVEKRATKYRQLRNPFPSMNVFSEDEIRQMHESALKLLETKGIKVLLPEARKIFAQGGGRVDDDDMVYIGRDIIEAALNSAPKSIHMHAGTREKDEVLELGSLTFLPGSGTPHATDRVRGRRPGRGQDFKELCQIVEQFDVMHFLTPMTEAQDVEQNLRHYFYMETQLTYSEKMPYVYARGTPQTLDSFEMVRDFRGLSDDEFLNNAYTYCIINTNSPRQIDIPMGQGLIDFARFGQPSIITPFTLMGAMAPITVAGAITLSHAECLASIALTQLARKGAPILYGTFTSNVDMKSGAPAFGTPEQFKATLAAGQLARLVGLPWRCAAGSASNINDSQAANENQFALWGCLLAGTTFVKQSAGWLEGGLSISYEKLITDIEAIQMVAEMCVAPSANAADIAMEAHDEVKPGGHFFGSTHTMQRYQTAFYEPLVADWSNIGTWSENGEKTATERATEIWQGILANDPKPNIDESRLGVIKDFVERRTKEGGALPES